MIGMTTMVCYGICMLYHPGESINSNWHLPRSRHI